jgi:hypothetical protein
LLLSCDAVFTFSITAEGLPFLILVFPTMILYFS